MNELVIGDSNKPIFVGEIKAEIKGLGVIEHNINIAYDYAVKLNKYYETKTFTADEIKEAKKTRAELNNMEKKIAEYRKSMVKEWKKPIDDFETVAKKTEKLIKTTSDLVNMQVKSFEEPKQLEEPTVTVDEFTGELIIEKTFKGTESQIGLLTEYAKSIGMEV